MKHWFARFVAAAVFGMAALTVTASAATFTQGQGYARLPVARGVDVPGKIVVTEFFWYNCPHCADFEPELEAWVKKLPPDVVFERVPVAFAPQFVAQQQLYYALKALGKADALQSAIFTAIHQQHIPLLTRDQMANWLQGKGIPKQQFLAAFNSFGVQMDAKRATQMVSDYQISGVPTMAVQGTYTMSASMPQTPTNAKVLDAVDQMVQQVRASLKK